MQPIKTVVKPFLPLCIASNARVESEPEKLPLNEGFKGKVIIVIFRQYYKFY